MSVGVENRFDVIVVGAGLMGSATAWSLSRRGRSVRLVERHTPANAQGSSHGSARIVRRAYADPLYTRLTGRAFELWRELELQSGTSLLRLLGGIDCGPAAAVEAMRGSLHAHQVSHELMPATEAEARWPGMRFDATVVFHPQAGTVDAAAAVGAFVAQAERTGAVIASGAEAAGIRSAGDGAEVLLADGARIAAPVVVIATGAWQEPLLAGIVELPRLTVTQQQIFHFPRRDAAAPPWPSVIDHGAMVYHLAGGRDGGPADDRKIAEHRQGTVTTAAQRSGVVDPGSRARIVEYVKHNLPGLEPSPRSETTCLYTTTPSEDFILDRVGPLVVCSACSGHGAKFAPLIGELTADLVTAPDRAVIPEHFRLAAHRH